MQVPIAEGKAQFPELVRRAEAGEHIIITRHGRVVAELRAASKAPPGSLLGALKGQIDIADDFDTLPDDFMGSFSGPIDPS